jgi:hypothetical protein
MRHGLEKKPSLKYLKFLRCDDFVQIPKENRSNLDNKAEKCIFIGYIWYKRL